MRSVRRQRDRWGSRDMRGDDRGMSLLEMIIAVAIFSIAAMSLLQAFVTSGRINNKSNLYLEATTTAQNVMEEIKSKSFTDIALAFNYPIDVSGNSRFSFLESKKSEIGSSLIIREVLKTASGDSYTYKNVSGTSSATAVSEDEYGTSYELNLRTKGSNASKYYFEMTGVECLSETFDVLVEFDGSSSTQYKKSGRSDSDGKNDYEMPNIAKLNSDENGFLILGEDWGLEMVQTWHKNNALFGSDATTEYLQENILPSVKRTLTIRFKSEGGIVTAEAQKHYEYTDSNGKVYCSDHNDTDSDHTSGYDDNYTAFFSTKVGSTLEGLYIFYYPNYNSTSSANTLDNIIFDNTTGMDVSLYVVKQKADGVSSDDEQGYRMSLTVKENPSKSNWNTNVSIYRAQTVLRTNLNYDISGDDTSSRTKINNQMSLTYQAVNSSGRAGTAITGTTAGTVLSLGNDLDDKEAADRIYTVKVSVYKAGAAAENFPEEDLVATLDGAKED